MTHTHLAVALATEGHGRLAADRHHARRRVRRRAFGARGHKVAASRQSIYCARIERCVVPDWLLQREAREYNTYLGNMSTTVHPSRSRYPARTLFACSRSIL